MWVNTRVSITLGISCRMGVMQRSGRVCDGVGYGCAGEQVKSAVGGGAVGAQRAQGWDVGSDAGCSESERTTFLQQDRCL